MGAIARRYNVKSVRDHVISPAGWSTLGCRLVAEWRRSKRVEFVCIDAARKIKQFAVSRIYEWKASLDTRGKAREVRALNGRISWSRLSRLVRSIERDQQGNGKFLLGRWDGRVRS